MKPELEPIHDQMIKIALDLAALCALIGPALAWIYQAGHIDCGHNCFDLHRIGETYRFMWPLAVAIALGTRAIYACRLSETTNILPPILVLIFFAIVTVFVWPYLSFFMTIFHFFIGLLIVPSLPFALCFGLDRALARFHGKSIQLPEHWWERLPIHASLLLPMIIIFILFSSHFELYLPGPWP